MDAHKPKIKLSNRVNIYDKLEIFKMNFESDYYVHRTEIDFYRYLMILRDFYKKFISEQKPITVTMNLKVDAKKKIGGEVFKIENNNLAVSVDPNNEIYKKNFQQSEILKFIEIEIAKENERLKMPKILISPLIEPENDFSENADKVKIIILERLGIIDFIKNKQQKPDTIAHTAEILSSITGISSKSIYTYLRPMLMQNKDDTDPNSPYKNPDNLLDANKTIHKFKLKNNDANL